MTALEAPLNVLPPGISTVERQKPDAHLEGAASGFEALDRLRKLVSETAPAPKIPDQIPMELRTRLTRMGSKCEESSACLRGVFGGCFDQEFDTASLRFFEQVRDGTFLLVVSDVTLDELRLAPEPVRSILAEIDNSRIELVASTSDSEALAGAYLDAKVVGSSCVDDARHIAVATITAVDIVVSWNFKHIVHYEKIMGYEGINTGLGYRSPRIYSPYEVISL